MLLQNSNILYVHRSILLCLHRNITKKAKLEHVGLLNQCKTDTNYETGQTFLHRVFAYRGVILYPWTAHIYERNRETSNKLQQHPDESRGIKQSIPKRETYYQVLVDSRDSAHISAHSEAVTFLTNSGNESQSLHTIPGIDYVSHEDIIPYTSFENIPLHHELFEKFLVRSKKQLLQATETLNTWQKKNHLCLELTNVHRETTDNIRVTAMPFFLGVKESPNSSQPSDYWWRYCIRIENLGVTSVRLLERYWRIISNGTVKTKRGRGVVGREPLLNSDQPAFQYSSHVSLHTATGQMWGTYRLEREDGEPFDVRIPAFSLESTLSTPESDK
ncbi:polymerase delta-interacting protein 2-like [Clavelina lepadiformis]|uniref:ApaG domain-containing protein n=1 Tax=Clavelina lepadiformis TaxID=159417 RepID=A0ABP0GTF0_CLALP